MRYLFAIAFTLSFSSAFATDLDDLRCDGDREKLSALTTLEGKLDEHALKVVEFYDNEMLDTSTEERLICRGAVTLSNREEGFLRYEFFVGKSGNILVEVTPESE